MTTSIVFIDSRVANYQTLIDSLTEPAQVFILDGASDGLAQMAAYLQGQTGIDAIHIISHGSQGALQLGSTLLTSANLVAYTAPLASIGGSLTQAGDILLYGCNVAQGDAGLQFINSLANLTGADVAASSDATGGAALGGDWVLEVQTGAIESAPSSALTYRDLLIDDTLGPSLVSLSLPTTINLSAGSTSVTFGAQAQDNVVGAGVDHVTLFLDHAINRGFAASNFEIGGIFGTGSDTFLDSTPTTANATFTLSPLTNSGVYNVTQAWIYDNAGNRTIYSAAQMQSSGINTSFTVTDGTVPDTVGPSLVSLSLPTTIDLSAGSTTTTFGARAEDNVGGTGVDHVTLFLDHAINRDFAASNFEIGGIFGTGSDTFLDSTPTTANATFTLSPLTNSGVYNVTQAWIYDNAGNRTIYSAAQMQSSGINTSFTVTDGTFVPNPLTVTPSTESGNLVLSLSVAQWSASTNSLAFSLSYDSSVVHFDSWRAGSSGGYAVSTSISEVGATGRANMSASISNSGDNSDFIQLIFSTTAQQGNFAYGFSSETLNSQTLANVFGNYSFSIVDTIAPTISTFSPLDEATGAAISSNIVLTFSEAVAKGTGNIVLKTAAGTTVATYDAASSTNLSITGSTLTINPTVDLAYSTGYKVEFAADTIKDVAGNSYAGTTSYNFTTISASLPLVTLSPTFPSGTEGNSGSKLMTLTATLSAAATTAVNVDYATANGEAVAGSDYTATSGTLTFATGETTKTFTVPILGDTAFEGDESFFVNLTSATGAVLGTNGTAGAIATITNDDSASLPIVTLSPTFPSVTEGNSGTKLMTMTATLSAAATSAVSVGYTTANGEAIAGSDYTATSGTLTFAIGETTKTFTVPVLGDTAFEGDESFFVNLTSATGAVLGTNGTAGAIATITNDDSASLPIVTLSPTFPSVTEGNSGTKLMTLTATLSAAAATAVSVGYATANGEAVAGSDYTATSGTLSFAIGETTKTFTVPILGDTTFEGDESFFVNLTSATGAVLGTNGSATAIATITNDDSPGAATQTFTGSTGNDSLTGSAGNDSIDGGAGTDIAMYSSSRANFALTKTSSGFTLNDNTGAAGTDSLQNVERIKFADGGIALDVGPDQPGGETQLLLGAVLGKDLLASKQPIIGAVIDLFDQGYTLEQLSGAVMRLLIWDVLTGKAAPTSTDIASYLLLNVNGATPDVATLADAVTALDAQLDINHNQGNFLWHLAESSANQTQAGLVGLAETGLAYM